MRIKSLIGHRPTPPPQLFHASAKVFESSLALVGLGARSRTARPARGEISRPLRIDEFYHFPSIPPLKTLVKKPPLRRLPFPAPASIRPSIDAYLRWILGTTWAPWVPGIGGRKWDDRSLAGCLEALLTKASRITRD